MESSGGVVGQDHSTWWAFPGPAQEPTPQVLLLGRRQRFTVSLDSLSPSWHISFFSLLKYALYDIHLLLPCQNFLSVNHLWESKPHCVNFAVDTRMWVCTCRGTSSPSPVRCLSGLALASTSWPSLQSIPREGVTKVMERLLGTVFHFLWLRLVLSLSLFLKSLDC